MSDVAIPWILLAFAILGIIVLSLLLNSKSNKIIELNTEIEKLNADIKILKKQLEDAKSNIDTSDKLSKDAKTEADKKIAEAQANADRKIEDAKAEADKKIAQVKDETSKAISAEAKAAADKKIADAMAEANKKIADATAEANKKIAEANDEAAKQTQSAIDARTSATTQVSALQTQISQLNVRLANYDKFLSDLKALLGALNNNSIEANRIINMDITNGLTVIDAMLKQKNDQIKSLEDSKGIKGVDASILNALLADNKNSILEVNNNMNSLRTTNTSLNNQLQSLATSINTSMTAILTAPTQPLNNESSLIVPTYPVGGVITNDYKTNGQALQALEAYIKTTRAVLNKVLTDTTNPNKPTSINKVGDLLSIISDYNSRITNLQNQLNTANTELSMLRSKYMRVGNRIPVRHLKDTILFGYDINTFRPNSPVDNFYYNTSYNDNVTEIAPYVCHNTNACTSYTISANNKMLEFPKMESLVIPDSDKNKAHRICPTGYITKIRDLWVQDADNSKTRRFLPNNGLRNQLLGKYEIKLNDLVDVDGVKILDRYLAPQIGANETKSANDLLNEGKITSYNLPEYRKWGFNVDCGNNPNIYYNSNMKPNQTTAGAVITDADGRQYDFIRSKSKIFQKTDNLNVGITRPEDIDWNATSDSINFEYKNENGSDTIDFTKIGGNSAEKGILFLNTEVTGQQLGEVTTVMDLKECVDHVNNITSTAGYNKVAMLTKEPSMGWRYGCYGYTDNSATDKLTLKRNTLGSRFHSTYVFPNTSSVPNFDF